MKKITVYLLAIICIATSCSKSGEKYILKPNMKAGESYTLEYKMDIEQDIMNMKNNLKMGISYLLKVKNVTPQRDIEMDFMYNRMIMEMKSDMLNVSYNSDSTYLPATGGTEANNAEQNMRNLYANSMGKLINKPIQVTLDSSGKIKLVTGYRELVKSIQDSTLLEDGDKPAVNSMMNEDQINQIFQQTFGTFPKKPVAIGEEWTSEINITQNGMLMKYTNTYKIIEVLEKENEAIIDFKGIISMGMTPNTTVKMDMSGTVNGNMVVNLASGLVKNGKQNIDIKMEMDMMDKKVPMTMKGTAIITGKKL